MARKSGTWVFDDATERDTFGAAQGVEDTDECILISDASRHYFDGAAWQPAAGTAATLAATLTAGNTTGGTDIEVTSGDEVRGLDGGAGVDGTGFTLRGGDHTAGDAAARTGADLTIRAGNTNSTFNASSGGDLTITAGSALGNGQAGKLTVTGGSGNQTITGGIDAEIGGGTSTGGNGSGVTLFRGTDSASTGRPGDTTLRGGDQLGSGNVPGGRLGLRPGNHRGGGAAAELVLRSAGPLGSTSNTTGPILITTRQTADAIFPAQGGTATDTGSITITTGPVGATANVSGNIAISTGDVGGATGNDPGDITLTAGSCTVANNFVRGGSVTITCGDGNANNSGGGGDFTVTAGDNNFSATPAGPGARGGNVTLTAGNDASDGVNCQPGAVTLNAGNGTGTNSPGANIVLNPGSATGTAAPGVVEANGDLEVSGNVNGQQAITHPQTSFTAVDGVPTAIDWSQTNSVRVDINAETTTAAFTFTGAVAGTSYTLLVYNGPGVGIGQSFPANVNWPGGAAPNVDPNALIRLYFDGTDFWGTYEVNLS